LKLKEIFIKQFEDKELQGYQIHLKQQYLTLQNVKIEAKGMISLHEILGALWYNPPIQWMTSFSLFLFSSHFSFKILKEKCEEKFSNFSSSLALYQMVFNNDTLGPCGEILQFPFPFSFSFFHFHLHCPFSSNEVWQWKVFLIGTNLVQIHLRSIRIWKFKYPMK
jgi:hypothetical protein